MNFQPHLIDELSRIKLTDWFFLKKNCQENLEICEKNSKNLSRATRYLDLIFFFRIKFLKNPTLTKKDDYMPRETVLKSDINYLLSYNHRFPILFESLILLKQYVEEKFFLDNNHWHISYPKK